jgi:hypothetical protein
MIDMELLKTRVKEPVKFSFYLSML